LNAVTLNEWQLAEHNYIAIYLRAMLYVGREYSNIEMQNTMSEKVTPRVDIAFKKLFGVEENKDLLIALINSIVSEEDQVVEVDLLNPYNPQNFKNEKSTILDIKARGETGKRYNIEIQINDEADYDKRALHYWAKLYTEQLGPGDGFSRLNKTIGIHILNFTSIPSVEKYHNVFNLCEKESKVHHFKDIELHTIELSKFENHRKDQKLNETDELKLLLSKVKTSLDRWVAFLTRHDLLKKLQKELKDPKVQKAIEVLEVMNFNPQEREAYEEHLKWLRVEASALKKSFCDGKAEGRADVVKNMLSQDVDINVIAKFTGLTVKEIEEIKKKLGMRLGLVEFS